MEQRAELCVWRIKVVPGKRSLAQFGSSRIAAGLVLTWILKIKASSHFLPAAPEPSQEVDPWAQCPCIHPSTSPMVAVPMVA